MTSTGIVMGTVSYMAPEYIQSGRCSAQGDLWAVGVMLYECLTGRKPFGGDNTTTILFKIVSEAPVPIEPDHMQGISPSVRDIVDRALSKDPAARFQTAEAFAKALRACRNPSWSGTLEATQAVPAPAAAPVPEGSPGETVSMAKTAMMPPDPGAPTALGLPQPPLPATEILAPAQPGKGWPHPGMLALVGAGLLLVGGVGAYFLFGRKPVLETTPHATVSPTPPAAAQPPAANPMSGAVPSAPAPARPKAPVKVTEPTMPAPPPAITPEAPKPEPAKAVVETVDQKLNQAVTLMATDPAQAAVLLRALASSHPSDARIQGNLLAALYRARDPKSFERVLDVAKAAGLSGPQMLQAAPAFRRAMADESQAHKAKDNSQVLPVDLLVKVAQ